MFYILQQQNLPYAIQGHSLPVQMEHVLVSLDIVIEPNTTARMGQMNSIVVSVLNG